MELLEKLNPVIEYAKEALLVGTLKKNVIKHFTNKGFTFEVAENIVEIAEVRVEKLSHYKFK